MLLRVIWSIWAAWPSWEINHLKRAFVGPKADWKGWGVFFPLLITQKMSGNLMLESQSSLFVPGDIPKLHYWCKLYQHHVRSDTLAIQLQLATGLIAPCGISKHNFRYSCNTDKLTNNYSLIVFWCKHINESRKTALVWKRQSCAFIANRAPGNWGLWRQKCDQEHIMWKVGIAMIFTGSKSTNHQEWVIS
jgi:hypothetical protein